MVTYDALNVLLSFGMFILASLTLVIIIIVLVTDRKKK